ncbi:CPBP family intramembrane glutamic endopeptidase [Halostagnicola bangensis]
MPNWTAFAAITVVVLVLLLVLSHLTQSAFSRTAESADRSDGSTSGGAPKTDDSDADPFITEAESEAVTDDRTAIDRHGREAEKDENALDSSLAETETARYPSEADFVSGSNADSQSDVPDSDSVRPNSTRDEPTSPVPAEMSTEMLLANVALSQGVFAVVLIGAAIYTGIPAEALGLEFSQSYLITGLVIGTGLGIALYVANEIGAAISTWIGFDHDEELRELLGPDSVGEWAVLLGFVLPVIAVFEELLFRAALIGVFEAGFNISPWFLAVVSSIAFGLGHGMQGSVGVIVTGALGFVLAAAFVLTGSFLVVVVAHYLINAFEFVVHEGIGFDWAAVLETDGGDR